MPRSFLRLAVAITMLALVTATPLQLNARSGYDFCECEWGAAYLYELDPDPWLFLDQYNIIPASTFIEPEAENAGQICLEECYNYTLVQAEAICNAYGFTAHHWQISFWYYFEDSDNDDGGTVHDYYTSGGVVRMCADYF